MVSLPFIIVAEKKRKIKPLFVGSILAILIVQLSLYFFHTHIIVLLFSLFVFFTAFTVLEATLPSLVAKIAPIQNKGAAMGVYSSSQFLGIFVGGSLGGFILSHALLPDIFLFCAVIALLWFCIAVFMT
jgi:predicted MFS family arabinose efflux permease